MAYTLKLRDKDGTVRWDCNGSSGNTNSLPTEIKDFQLRVGRGGTSFFTPDSGDGGFRTRKPKALVEALAVLRFDASALTVDQFNEAVGMLAYYLSWDGNYWEWSPDSSSETRYIDIVDANPEALLRGQANAGMWIHARKIDLAFPIPFVRKYALRDSVTLSSSTNKLLNGTLLIDQDASGRPDNWAWASATNISGDAISAANEAYSFAIATSSTRNLNQTTAASTFAQNDVVTFQFKAKIASGANCKARAVVQFVQSDGTTTVGSEHTGTLTTLSTTEQTLTVTTTAAGANTSRAIISIRFTNADATSYTVYLRHAQAAVESSASDFITGAEQVALNPYGHPIAIVDDFNRTATDSWGTAQRGGAWTVTDGAAADHDVVATTTNPHGGSQVHSAANTTKQAVTTSTVQNLDAYVSFQVRYVPTGANSELFFVFRRVDANNYYRARVVVTITTGAITLGLEKVVAGVPSTVAAQVATGETASTTGGHALRVYCSGTAIKAKLWVGGANGTRAAEPAAWDIDTTDSSLTAAGTVGLMSFLNTGATGTPRTHYWANLVVQDLGTNAYAGRVVPLYIQGQSETPVKLTVKGKDSDCAVQVVNLSARGNEGVRGRRYLSDYLNTTKTFALSGATMGTNTAAISANDGFSRAAAATDGTGGSDDEMVKRVRLQVTTNLESLRGEWIVFLRMRQYSAASLTGVSAADRSTTFVSLAWSPSLASPCTNRNPEALYDSSVISSDRVTFPWEEVNLGRIQIPETGTLAGVAFEVWTRNTDAEGSEYDALILVPADGKRTQIVLPALGYLQVLGKDVTSQSGTTVDGNARILNSAADYAEHSLGAAPATARYRGTLRYSIVGTSSGTFAARSSATVISTVDLETTDGEYVASVEWDGTSGTTYELRATDTTGEIHVNEVIWERVATLAENETLVSDPTDLENLKVEKFDSSSQYQHEVKVAGPTPLVLTPGLWMLYVAPLDPRYEGVMAELESSIERTVEVSYSYTPRFEY